KIELNRRMSETLEAMARALFKSWFVDFDPVRAKMEGRWKRGHSLPGLPAHLYDLFPDRLVDSELGEIPEGWEVESLGDHFDAVKGVSYKGSGLAEDGMPLHNLNSIYEGGGYKYEGIKYYTGEYGDRHIVVPGDVVVANTEQGHDRLLIGYAAVVPAFFGDKGIASHHLYRLRPKPRSPLTAVYLCSLLNSPQMHDTVSGYANGTTVNMLPVDGVQMPAIHCPPKDIITVFDSLATYAIRRREEIAAESRTLAALRDALLPKLISGELRIQDAERFLKEGAL
ncbi:MAG: restriction endonuclease subunit S, partial [Planctomycetota bacterium]